MPGQIIKAVMPGSTGHLIPMRSQNQHRATNIIIDYQLITSSKVSQNAHLRTRNSLCFSIWVIACGKYDRRTLTGKQAPPMAYMTAIGSTVYRHQRWQIRQPALQRKVRERNLKVRGPSFVPPVCISKITHRPSVQKMSDLLTDGTQKRGKTTIIDIISQLFGHFVIS